MVSEMDTLEPAAEDTAGVIPTPLASSASHGEIGITPKELLSEVGDTQLGLQRGGAK